MKLVHNKRAKYIERKAHQSSSDVLSLEIDSNYSLITEEIDYRRVVAFLRKHLKTGDKIQSKSTSIRR